MKHYTTEVREVTSITKGVIIHGVNCQGAMGSGIAGAIARKWPGVRQTYLDTFNALGRLNVRPTPRSSTLLGRIQPVKVDSDLVVINAFTQDYFGGDGRVYASTDAIAAALSFTFDMLSDSSSDDDPIQVYMPQIGCGLGGLSWDDQVEPIVNELMTRRPFKLTIITL